MASIADPIHDALKALLTALPVTPTVTMSGARWAPSMIPQAPAAVIDIPTIERTPLDTGERELGSDDWRFSFPVHLYVDLKVAERDQQRAIDLLEAFIHAVDADPSLGISTIDDTKVISGRPAFDLSEEARPLLDIECEVQVWQRVPYP